MKKHILVDLELSEFEDIDKIARREDRVAGQQASHFVRRALRAETIIRNNPAQAAAWDSLWRWLLSTPPPPPSAEEAKS